MMPSGTAEPAAPRTVRMSSASRSRRRSIASADAWRCQARAAPRPRGSRRGCAGRSRSGRCCRPSRGRCRRRSASASSRSSAVGRHDLARLAVAALHDVERRPRPSAPPCARARRQAFDRRHLAPGDRRHRRRARAHRLAVDVHRAGAALGDAAAVLGAGEAEVLAHDPEQRRVRIDVDSRALPLTLSVTGM